MCKNSWLIANVDSAYKLYVDVDHGHIITGNLNIVKEI